MSEEIEELRDMEQVEELRDMEQVVLNMENNPFYKYAKTIVKSVEYMRLMCVGLGGFAKPELTQEERYDICKAQGCDMTRPNGHQCIRLEPEPDDLRSLMKDE